MDHNDADTHDDPTRQPLPPTTLVHDDTPINEQRAREIEELLTNEDDDSDNGL